MTYLKQNWDKYESLKVGRCKDLLERYKKINEQSGLFIMPLFAVFKSLETISNIVKILGDTKLSRDISGISNQIEKVYNDSKEDSYRIDEKRLIQLLKDTELQKHVNKIATTFKQADDSKTAVKYGRKIIHLQDVFINLTDSIKRFYKGLLDDGWDVRKHII
jgi:hypothetical protein